MGDPLHEHPRKLQSARTELGLSCHQLLHTRQRGKKGEGPASESSRTRWAPTKIPLKKGGEEAEGFWGLSRQPAGPGTNKTTPKA